MKLNVLLGAALALVSTVAFADTTQGSIMNDMNAPAALTIKTVVPWGDWLASTLASLGSLAIALLTFVVAKWAPAYVRVLLTDDAIAKAVNYGLGAVEGAVAGKTLTLETANVVLSAAERYAIAQAPDVAKWLGNNLRPVILAELNKLGVLPDNVSASNTATVIAPSGK